ncbi:MAG: ArsR/SmtB family transcription factor, partial [Acidimicrobiales bacterium]
MSHLFRARWTDRLLLSLLVVLADPTRRQVVELLAEHPRRAGELAEAVGTSRSAMSQHLRVLVDTGVIDDER